MECHLGDLVVPAIRRLRPPAPSDHCIETVHLAGLGSGVARASKRLDSEVAESLLSRVGFATIAERETWR